MNCIKLDLFLLFCLLFQINNKVINTQFSYNHKYCLEENDSFFGKIDNLLTGLGTSAYHLINTIDSFTDRNYLESQKHEERYKRFRLMNPDYELKKYIKEHDGIKCVIYDKKFEFFDDRTMLEIPYNIRPIN